MKKLIGSAPTINMLIKKLNEFFYSKGIELVSINEKTWKVFNNKCEIHGCIVIKKGKQYRFERV